MVSRFWRAGGTALGLGGFEAVMVEEGPFNYVGNGGFSSGAGWTVAGSNAAITGGVFSCAGGAGGKSATTTATATLTADTFYRTQYTILTRSFGNISINVGGAQGAFRSTTGTFVQYLKTGASPTQAIALTGSSISTFTADDFSVHLAATSLGPELAIDGGFDDPGSWSVDLGGEIVGGKLQMADFPGTAQGWLSSALVAGTWYEVTFTIDSVSQGGVQLRVGDDITTLRETAGTFTQHLVATSSVATHLQVLSGHGSGGPATTATIDNISVRQVIFA